VAGAATGVAAGAEEGTAQAVGRASLPAMSATGVVKYFLDTFACLD
jgi:hypothetical protein